MNEECIQLASQINQTLEEAGVTIGAVVTEGITTGCHWCPLSLHFQVWLPVHNQPEITVLTAIFKSADFSDVTWHNCANIGAPAFLQLDAWD